MQRPLVENLREFSITTRRLDSGGEGNLHFVFSRRRGRGGGIEGEEVDDDVGGKYGEVCSVGDSLSEHGLSDIRDGVAEECSLLTGMVSLWNKIGLHLQHLFHVSLANGGVIYNF